MTHFALIAPPFPSHIRAFEAIAESLRARGHRCTFVLPEEARLFVESSSVAIAVLAPGRARPLFERLERAGRPNGPFGILRTVSDAAGATEALCQEGPAILRRIGAEAILGDEMEPAAGLLARHLGLPQISIACALPIEADRAIPPPFLDWPFDPSPKGLKRNRGAARVTRLFLRRQRRAIEECALRFGLAGLSTIEDCLSPLATIAQTVEGLDFPRGTRSRIHHVGPLRAGRPMRESLPFKFDPARPLVYASLGTLQGHRHAMFEAIARGAARLDAQLVVAHCGGLSASKARALRAHYVAEDLPQAAVLAHADLCVTHGGLNTVLDALSFGVPVLAVPIAFDQPGVAARVERAGAGRKLSRLRLSARTVGPMIEELLRDERYRSRARGLGAEIAAAGGADAAAGIVEACLRETTPVQPMLAEAAE